MRKLTALFAPIVGCLIFVDFTGNVWGSELSLFEKTYIRETQKPKVVTDNFTVADLSGSFALVVKNGKDGNNRVSSAVIKINGKQILGPSDFSQQVDLVTRDFTLRESNEITVELRSKPGSFIVVNIIAEGQNTPPVANAGPDQTVPLGSTVTLDGSKSSDADGDLLAFKWSFDALPPDSTATLNDPSAIKPTFLADKPGNYVLKLIVNDGKTDSASSTVTISTLNSRPVANAGPDQTAYVAQTITLDGSVSTDPDGDTLTFQWMFLAKPDESNAGLSDPAAVAPTFVLDIPGTYTIQLIVNDGKLDSLPAAVTVNTANSAPVANAGPDQAVYVTQTVTLDGSGSSDVDGDPLTYSWSLINKPAQSTTDLSGKTTVNPAFVIDRPGTYIAQLIVSDDLVSSTPDTVTVTTLNSKPVAEAGPNQAPFVTSTVTLDGSQSTDADGDSLTHQWSFVSKPAASSATLSNPTAKTPSFVVDSAGTYVIQLIVHDGQVNSDPDTVTITTANTKPVAEAGQDQTVLLDSTVVLDGSGSSDVDADSLTYLWSFQSRPAESTAVLSNSNQVQASFAPDKPGAYVVQLLVNDGKADSNPDIVTVTANIPTVVVPNVVGMLQSAAESAIVGATLAVGQVTTAYSGTVPAGSVISQSPAAGSSVPRGSLVSLVISLGPESVVVPNVVGILQAAAEAALVSAQLAVGTVTTAASATVPAGYVISQAPAAGTSVSPHSTVNFVISSGPPPLVPVPDVVGMVQAAAESSIQSASLSVGSVLRETSARVPAGQVMRQTPKAGTLVQTGSSVSIVVSLGSIAWEKSFAWNFTRQLGDLHSMKVPYSRKVLETRDSGHVFLVNFKYDSSTFPDDYAIGVFKMDNSGSLQWQKTFDVVMDGWARETIACSIQQTTDGGYVIAGEIRPAYPHSDILVLKLDETGNAQWQKVYAATDKDTGATSIQQTADGGYILTGGGGTFGKSNPLSFGSDATFISKLNSEGGIIWQKEYRSASNAASMGFNAVQQTNDGGYILIGNATESYLTPQGTLELKTTYDGPVVMKLDGSGNVVWQRYHAGGTGVVGGTVSGPFIAYSGLQVRALRQLSDGGLVLAGLWSVDQTLSGGGVMKLNASGAIEWQKIYYGDTQGYGWGIASEDHYSQKRNTEFVSVNQTADGGFVLSDQYNSKIFKLAPSGDIDWQKSLVYPVLWGVDRDILQTRDGNYLAFSMRGGFNYRSSGYLYPYVDDGNGYAWILKLNSDGTSGCEFERDTALISSNGTSQQREIPVVVNEVSLTARVAQTSSRDITAVQGPPLCGVNEGPYCIAPSFTDAYVGRPFSLQLSWADPDVGDALTFSLLSSPSGLTIGPSGLVQWTPTINQIGDFVSTIQCTDRSGVYMKAGTTTTVTTANYPQITSTPVTSAMEGQLYTYQVTAADADTAYGDTIKYSLNIAPSGMAIDQSTGLITWTPISGQIGDREVQVFATDLSKQTGQQRFTIKVGWINHPPVITSTPKTTATVGQYYYSYITAQDPDALDTIPTLTGSLAEAPAGMTIKRYSSLWLIEWTPASDQIGPFGVTIKVSDVGGLSATQSFTITVSPPNHAPVITSTPPTTAVVGQPYTYQMVATDPDGDSLWYGLTDSSPLDMMIDHATG